MLINDIYTIRSFIYYVAVFNLAAESHVDRSIDKPENFIKSNILGVYNLLESILICQKKFRNNIKLIHVSTDEVYGDLVNGKSDENFPYNPSSPYSATKAGADHLIKAYIRTYKISALISNGFGDKIVVSHDICHKHSMSSYGGHGYSHILENIAPRMAQRGFTKDQINAIIIENPARLLTFS